MVTKQSGGKKKGHRHFKGRAKKTGKYMPKEALFS